MDTRTFDLLTPHVVVEAVESGYGLHLDGTLSSYPSYINRVYELRDLDGACYIAKFYRPGRWAEESIREEHGFVLECARADIPVVAPLPGYLGNTLSTVLASGDGIEESFHFALYPKRGGRNYDGESEDDWIRLGRLVGRVHSVARSEGARARMVCTPGQSSLIFVREIQEAGVVHPDCREEFLELAAGAMEWISPLWEGVELQRVHGDCHRGNILDRPGEGLLLIDFDDMLMAPAIQDLWLLLPGSAAECRRELNLILEGYEEMCDLDPTTLRLIEPLRLMRMIYYLAWSARQREDRGFREAYPDWGGEAFWLKEIEDLRSQIDIIQSELDGGNHDGWN